MTRQAFLARLREGLAGLPAHVITDIVADYETHFADGVAAGRTEAEVAAALGDPSRLARELRAEHGMKRWEEQRSPSAAGGAIFALLGLGAIDIIFLLPLLMGVLGAIFGIGIAVIAVFFAGGVVFAAGPFTDPPGGPVAALLAGIGMMSGAASVGALLTIVVIGLMNALVWYGRLHYRLLKPALEPQGAA
ncbi:DUF1700 domain-containing protein [Phenylobacterium sp. J367]|uniref:DUF1700 domain-containing protein n=1 Tax=Phenylobacterium sp. J367 TaxID=2898435 RepID=UPI0021507E97|nr:DUF1700 domain-containing protein [Phenylobacterium sp. J367]MCR5880356.1 DUF1700 domain-containing protein [Phenylobacterium sp. J367]